MSDNFAHYSNAYMPRFTLAEMDARLSIMESRAGITRMPPAQTVRRFFIGSELYLIM